MRCAYYDNDMHRLKERVKLAFVPVHVIYVDFVAYPEFLYMVYSYQKKGVVHCAMVKLGIPNAHKLMEPVELDTTQIGWGLGQ